MAKFCTQCGTKVGLLSQHNTINGLMCSNCYQNLINDVKNQIQQVKKFDTTYHYGKYYFDGKNKQLLINKISDCERINYSQIISYNIINEGHDKKKKHGITRAIVGGALAGGVGAIVGAVTGGKNYDYVDRLGVNITLQGGDNVEILLIDATTKVQTLISESHKILNKIISILDSIIAENNSEKTNNDATSQLKQLKELADQGVITQDDFEAKKKQILGI